MSAEVEVTDAVAGLYRLPPGEFVAGRDQLARQLRAAGDREAARRVAALRRPSISAWAANQLARAAPHAMAELLEVGAALAEAQQDALAGQPGAARRLRTSSAQLRAAISRLTQRAETLLDRAGHAATDATLDRLAATLRAAATADEATRAALAEGRLPEDLDPAGFGPLLGEVTPADAAPAGAAPMPPATPAPVAPVADSAATRRAREAAQRALERTGQAAERARAALEQAEAMAAAQRQAALAARQREDELDSAAQDLAEQAAAAATAAGQARQQAETADRDAEALTDRLRLAQEAASAAEAAHAAATAALEEFQVPQDRSE
jgi:DNA repair exonuclease SbcCD ATPase subunit